MLFRSFNNIISMLPRCRSGELTALAVTSPQRSPVASDIPSLAQSGLADYDMSNWAGIVGPRGMPPATADRVSAAITAAVNAENVSAAFRSQGMIPCGDDASAFAHFMRSERERWRPVLDAIRAGSDEHRTQ